MAKERPVVHGKPLDLQWWRTRKAILPTFAIYLENLTPTLTERHIREHYARYSQVDRVFMATEGSESYAFVHFSTWNEASAAAKTNSVMIAGEPVSCDGHVLEDSVENKENKEQDYRREDSQKREVLDRHNESRSRTRSRSTFRPERRRFKRHRSRTKSRSRSRSKSVSRSRSRKRTTEEPVVEILETPQEIRQEEMPDAVPWSDHLYLPPLQFFNPHHYYHY